MRVRRGLAALVVSVTIGSLVMSCDAVTGGSAAVAPTVTGMVTPFDAFGRIDGAWSVVADPQWTLDCGQASPVAVGPNVQECGPGAAGAAVCWGQPGQHDVFCGDGPWDTSVRKLYSADPVVPVQAPVDPQPWGVVLIDGSRCTLINSGAWAPGPDGTSPAYACTKDGRDSDLYVLAAGAQPIDRSAAVWTALVGQIGNTPTSLPPPTTVPIREARFAG